ncbi:MAG TPA: CpsB/CapC family capsule biosynthesis tyrosine phosphatase [Polyangiales bacterium]|nr:CpsB/CapC family capsule biosynthesis tyrosine phosphatase [Polyangiales bacterium]
MSLARCDLHCHYLPGVDDGVPTAQDGIELVRGLSQLGYTTVVATPHIRTGMFDNHKPQLEAVFGAFNSLSRDHVGLPERGLAAEHFFDDVFFGLLERGAALPYPGGHAALIEFATDRMPLRIEEQFFHMQVRGVRPVIAHPERYTPVWKDTTALSGLLDRGALALLDLMALTGKYGRRPQRCAEELLEEDLYFAACSDCHKPEDLGSVERGIARLVELVGADYAELLLADHPRQILEGTVQD